MDRAGSAETLTAAELGSDQAQLVAQHPKQGHVLGDIDLADNAVDTESVQNAPTRRLSSTASTDVKPFGLGSKRRQAEDARHRIEH
jgi:hypothetical protein